MMRWAVLWLVVLVAGTAGVGEGAAAGAPSNRSPSRASVELVLALDGSASITASDLEFQLQGHAAAFRDPNVAAAVAASGVAVTMVVYSNPNSLKVLLPWTLLDSEAAAVAFAARIDAIPRKFQGDSTGIGAAIEDSADLFEKSGFRAPRRVIDLVSNGFSNSGIDVASARDRVVNRGITVNGLAILDEYPWLEDYFRENVIGGDGCFVKSATDQASFVEALRQKLIQEIAVDSPMSAKHLAGIP